jgi:D-alanyl-lipoteichoic acid acyltransferase DltB (MBOAT superfamily)
MLFNSSAFLFAFLPVVLAGAFLLARRGGAAAILWLVVASCFFYGWWDVRYLALLAGSVLFNHAAGNAIAVLGGRGGRGAAPMLAFAIAANLLLLGWFKYAGFIAGSVAALAGATATIDSPVLPLGISFFTFTQIAYLVDVYRHPVRYGIAPYALFVTYFPHLIAGPILHHREMMPQFQSATAWRFSADNVAAGLTIFAIGLFKKTVLADGIGPYANPVFDHAAGGLAPGFFEAWGAALAFGLQLYFDFSGYSDMAIGLSKLFGVQLPVNFESPYKATSLIDFWRRWHMTLSRFLRDYLYVPLGGSRRGPLRHHVNLLATMALGGLWHGAGWTFVLWGVGHGVLLSLNHGWRSLRGNPAGGPAWLLACERAAGAAATFIAVFALWVVFRAADVSTAGRILAGMAGLNGFALPATWTVALATLAERIAAAGYAHWIPTALLQRDFVAVTSGLPPTALQTLSAGVFFSGPQLLWTVALLGAVWLLPNTRQVLERSCAFLVDARTAASPAPFTWRVSMSWALLSAGLLVASLLSMSRVSEFLYFQF